MQRFPIPGMDRPELDGPVGSLDSDERQREPLVSLAPSKGFAPVRDKRKHRRGFEVEKHQALANECSDLFLFILSLMGLSGRSNR